MSKNDSNLEPKMFKIKLKYKVDNEYHYLILNKFDFYTIREPNMIHKKKKEFEIDLSNGDVSNNFEKYIKTHDISYNYKFYIPLSQYYFTFDNFEAYLNDISYSDNKNNFFIIDSENKEKKEIINFFKFLQKNLIENKKVTQESNKRIYSSKETLIQKLNTDEYRKKIVQEYGKYILNDDYYKNNDIHKLYTKLQSDVKTLSFIITYYNIFKILELFYLPYGCILYEKFYKKIFNQNNNKYEIKNSKEKIHVKIKSIKCIKYTDDLLYESFQQNDFLIPVYEIEFEEIPNFSKIIFNINIIDRLNDSNKLESYLKEKQHNEAPVKKLQQILKKAISQYKKEKSIKKIVKLASDEDSLKKKIENINSDILIYKNYNNNIYSKNKNINPTTIYFDKDLNIKDALKNFNVIKNNNIIFDNLNVKTLKDALMISDTFNILKINNKLISGDDTANEYITEYIEKIFFIKGKHLFINNKYALIKNVKKRLLNSMTDEELINNKLKDETINKIYINKKPSKNICLEIDDVDSSYYVYLDVEVIYKKSITDKIPLKHKISYASNCRQNATVLDTLLFAALGINNYPKNFLENKINKINKAEATKAEATKAEATKAEATKAEATNAEATKAEAKEGVGETAKEIMTNTSQRGGSNKNLTRKIRKNNIGYKNLIHFYAI